MSTNRPKAPVLLLATSLLTGACAYQPYDANDPQQYIDYWCQPENVRDSLLYNLSKEQDEQHPSAQPQTPPVTDAERYRRCVEHHHTPVQELLPRDGKA